MPQPRITIGDFEPNVIVEGARTPVGRLQGALKSLSATQLGGVAIAGALERSGIGSGLRSHGPGIAGRGWTNRCATGGGAGWCEHGCPGNHN